MKLYHSNLSNQNIMWIIMLYAEIISITNLLLSLFHVCFERMQIKKEKKTSNNIQTIFQLF